MTYGLAKQLRDAGFPQGMIETTFLHGRIYAPTLSELIEACGNDFGMLIRGTDGTFVATPSTPLFNVTDNVMDTPEEAVARLYLAINQNATPTA